MSAGDGVIDPEQERREAPWARDASGQVIEARSRLAVISGGDERSKNAIAVDLFEAQLRRNPQRGVVASYGNIVLIVRGLWGKTLACNAMQELVELDGIGIDDAAVGRLRCEVEARFSFAPDSKELARALVQVASERRYHPVQSYLSALPPWDEVRRWALIPGSNFGLDISQTSAVGPCPPLPCVMLQRWAISCVARAFEPGCQVDHVLVLQGKEERRKSTFFRVLGGEWFGEGDVEIGVEGVRALSTAWLWCWDELAGLSKKEQASLDGFITRPKDVLRPLYRNPVHHPRTTVLVATAGPNELIHAPTGGRRWWIIPVLRKMLDGEIEPLREQLWAEALHDYHEGLLTPRGKAVWWLESDSDIAAHADMIDGYRVTGGWDVPIATWLAGDFCRGLLHRDGREGWITINDVLSGLDVAVKDRESRGAAMHAASALRRAGWLPVEPRPRYRGIRVSAYAPPV